MPTYDPAFPALFAIVPMIEFFLKGGFFMVLLLICSIVMVAVAVWRGLLLRRENVLPAVLSRAIEQLEPGAPSEHLRRLARLSGDDPSSLGGLISVALRHLKWPRSENVEAVQTYARRELARLERGLIALEVVVGVAPLLGLLGTVSGLVQVFATLGVSEAAGDPRGIASGIAEALNTTIVGLVIAIPSLIAHSYFTRKVEGMAIEMESAATDLIMKCYTRRGRSAGDEPARPQP